MENPVPEGLGNAAAAQGKGNRAARQRLWDCRWMCGITHGKVLRCYATGHSLFSL